MNTLLIADGQIDASYNFLQPLQKMTTQIQPSMANKVDITRVITWGSDPFSLGAYSHFAPGQIGQYAKTMAQPWRRIYFAGEHTAITSPGMEAALESAERSVEELVSHVNGRK